MSELTQTPASAMSPFAPDTAQSRGLLLGLALATGMEFYTFDSVNLVLADMTGTLGLSADEASWLLTVYSSALFLGVPISIWLAGHFGYKRYLIATTLLFAVTSMGCAVSSNLSALLIWRGIQGFAGAGLVMWWRASVYLLMPKAQRSPSLMRISTVLYLSSAAGLLVSGYLTDHFNWRLIFLPNLLFAGAADWLLLRHFPKVPPPTSTRLIKTDWIGIVLLASALICLQIALNRGQIDDWFGALFIRTLAFICIVALVAFIFWQHSPRNVAPLLDLALLRNRYVMSSILIGLLTGMILSGSLFVLPEFLRNVSTHTYSATQTGQIICIYALTAAAVRPLIVPLIARLGQRKTIALALSMLIASMLLLHQLLTTSTPAGNYVLPLILFGLCLSPLLPAVGSGTVARIEPEKLLDGVSLYMTFRQFGASLGVALLNVLLAHRESLHSGRLFEHLQTNNSEARSWLGTVQAHANTHGYSPFESHHVALVQLIEAAKHQAETLSYADAFAFMAVIGVLALCLIPIIPPTPVIQK